jgi:hypothetical protein
MSTWTAAEIGAYDQFLAEADAEVARLVTTLQAGIGEAGERQAMANVTLLVCDREPAALSGLLVTALRRLAADGG